MLKTSHTRLYSVPLITGLLGCAACQLHAQTASENYGIITGLAQGNAAVNGSQALKNVSCAPTSVANGLGYLNAYQQSFGNNYFTVSPNTYTAVNSLQSAANMNTTVAFGTSGPNALSGTQSYLVNNNPAPNVTTSQTADPTSAALASVLKANDGVQLGILWATGANPINGGASWTPANGGHFVSLDSINMTAGSGTIGILDPWGAGVFVSPGVYNASTTPTQETLDASLVTLTAGGANAMPAGTYLEITYQGTPPVGDFPQLPSGVGYASQGGETGLIALDQVEAVPEPASLLISVLATVGVGGFVLIRHRKQQA